MTHKQINVILRYVCTLTEHMPRNEFNGLPPSLVTFLQDNESVMMPITENMYCGDYEIEIHIRSL